MQARSLSNDLQAVHCRYWNDDPPNVRNSGPVAVAWDACEGLTHGSVQANCVFCSPRTMLVRLWVVVLDVMVPLTTIGHHRKVIVLQARGTSPQKRAQHKSMNDHSQTVHPEETSATSTRPSLGRNQQPLSRTAGALQTKTPHHHPLCLSQELQMCWPNTSNRWL